jgi:hypothetical protein
MKPRNVLTLLAGLFFTTVALSAAPSAQGRECSSVRAAGKWGFTLSGTAILPIGPIPIAAVGRTTIDAGGNATGTEARSVDGNFANETLTGTLTVKPDCTGTITVEFFESGKLVRTSVVSIVFVDNMREFLGVQESLALPKGTSLPVVITVDAKRIFSAEEND